MGTVKVGIREFRENLAGYLESGTPLAIMRHGETLGFYIPAQKRSRKAELAAMRAAAKDFDKMIAAWGAREDELMDEYKEIRRAAREKSGMPSRALVVDANILIRAVPGKRARDVIESFAENVSFFVPEAIYREAEEHLSELVVKRGGDPGEGARALALLGRRWN